MEIQESTLSGFYCSRFFGLAPYVIKKNAKNRVDDFRRAPWLCIYSICFITVAGKRNQFVVEFHIDESDFNMVQILC